MKKETLPKIERGIPVPDLRRPEFKGVTSLIRKMKVGDSFLWRSANHEYNNLYNYAAILRKKITVRRVTKAKIRVWRVA